MSGNYVVYFLEYDEPHIISQLFTLNVTGPICVDNLFSEYKPLDISQQLQSSFFLKDPL